MKTNIGIIGLAVMGENLALNLERNNYTVSVYNRSKEKITNFINNRAKGKRIYPAYSLEEFVEQLERPRKILLMIKVGYPVDNLIEKITPLLSPGDILIDGGNSYFAETERRIEKLENKGILYIGAGISGGEDGALNGPAIMPGGSQKAWEQTKNIFQSIAAKNEDGTCCCDFIGAGGAGHFVKMIHNGIEYAIMQSICECYHLLKKMVHLNNDELSEVFGVWNKGKLRGYLIEITSNILKYKGETQEELIDKILDVAGQKGTGKNMIVTALDYGIPLPITSEAVFARYLSLKKEERILAVDVLKSETTNEHDIMQSEIIKMMEDSLYVSIIINYAQCFSFMRDASNIFGWNLNFASIANIWKNGCIIRSDFLNDINKAFSLNNNLTNLLLDETINKQVAHGLRSLRKICAVALSGGLPIPVMSSILAYYDGYRCNNLPINLLQAQRDYFGAHTYERIDRNRGEFFHTNWSGHGGETTSSSYNA